MKMMWLIAFTPIAGPPSGPLFEAGWLLPHPHISNSIGSSNARFSIVGHVRLAVAAQAGCPPRLLHRLRCSLPSGSLTPLKFSCSGGTDRAIGLKAVVRAPPQIRTRATRILSAYFSTATLGRERPDRRTDSMIRFQSSYSCFRSDSSAARESSFRSMVLTRDSMSAGFTK